MTYNVSNATLNPAHSLTHIAMILVGPLVVRVHWPSSFDLWFDLDRGDDVEGFVTTTVICHFPVNTGRSASICC